MERPRPHLMAPQLRLLDSSSLTHVAIYPLASIRAAITRFVWIHHHFRAYQALAEGLSQSASLCSTVPLPERSFSKLPSSASELRTHAHFVDRPAPKTQHLNLSESVIRSFPEADILISSGRLLTSVLSNTNMPQR